MKKYFWTMTLVIALSIGMFSPALCGTAQGESSLSIGLSSTKTTVGTEGGRVGSTRGYECSSYTTLCSACTITCCVCNTANCSSGYYDAGGTHYPFDTHESDSIYNAAQHAIAKCCK